MTTYPLDTLSVTLDESGISAPPYSDIYASLQATYTGIFGSDAYLAPDSQDGQWIAAMASAINDANAAAISVYNSFSPTNAQGAGLASLVKINGIAKDVATNSSSDVQVVGQAGTVINGGIIGDIAGLHKWLLPDVVTIPNAGTVTVTATCQDLGAIDAPVNTLTQIVTPTLGWQSVNNSAAATPGAPIEDDADLRRRQTQSTALPSVTPLKGLKGSLYNLSGVSELEVYDNDTNATDANGIPSHSIAVIINGGDSQAIADTILAKKTLGGGTVGSTSVISLDPYGVPKTIKFSRPILTMIDVHVSLTALTGYTSSIGQAVIQSIVDYVNSLSIGTDVLIRRLDLPAQLFGGAGSETYELTALTICLHGGSPGTVDLPIAYNAEAGTQSSYVTLTVI